jgi:hypothetical protein
MNRGRSRWLFRLGVPLVLGVGALVWFAVQESQVVLTFENHSGEVVSVLEVTAGGKTTALRDVAAGAQASAAIPAGHFDVDGRLADGTRIRGHFGQLSGPAANRPRLVILPGGELRLRQGDKPPPR